MKTFNQETVDRLNKLSSQDSVIAHQKLENEGLQAALDYIKYAEAIKRSSTQQPKGSNTTHIGIDPDSTSGVDTGKSAEKVHKETHEKMSENSTKNFFNERVLAFDTETTNLNMTDEDFTKRGRIWQVGLAVSDTKGIDGLEGHVNPFFGYKQGKFVQTGKVSDPYLRDKLRKSNGQFSEKTYSEGKFEPFIKLYNDNQLASLDKAITDTMGKVTHNDVIVLQNMNFENSVLKSSVEQGILSRDVYDNIASRMRTVGTDHKGNTTQIFQRPSEVVSKVREADMVYHTSYLTSLDDKQFETYKNLLNDSFDAYKSIIKDPNRTGAVAVELQDITKTFLANAASEGHIDKRTATLGLNVEFLASTILKEEESHTALSDSKQTIRLMNKLGTMTEELRSKSVSSETLEVLSRIRGTQGSEVNKRFVSSVRSVLNDFKTNGFTNISDGKNWYQPTMILRELDGEGLGQKKLMPKVSVGPKPKTNTSLSDALNTVLSRYSQYNENLYDFSRKDYVSNIIKEHESGINFNQLHNKVDSDFFAIKPPKELNTTANYVTDSGLSRSTMASDVWGETVELFGKKMQRKTRTTILGGVGAGLAFMAFQDRPHPVQNNKYDNVSENFYDEQYLGTAFVDFRERNKHYMM